MWDGKKKRRVAARREGLRKKAVVTRKMKDYRGWRMTTQEQERMEEIRQADAELDRFLSLTRPWDEDYERSRRLNLWIKEGEKKKEGGLEGSTDGGSSETMPRGGLYRGLYPGTEQSWGGEPRLDVADIASPKNERW